MLETKNSFGEQNTIKHNKSKSICIVDIDFEKLLHSSYFLKF